MTTEPPQMPSDPRQDAAHSSSADDGSATSYSAPDYGSAGYTAPTYPTSPIGTPPAATSPYETSPYATSPYETSPYASPTYSTPSYQPGYPVPVYSSEPSYPSGTYPAPGSQLPSSLPPGSLPPNFPPPGAPLPGAEPHKPKAGRGSVIVLAAVVAAIVGGGVGATSAALVNRHHDASETSAGLSATTSSAPSSVKIDGTVTAAAAKIQPSVVTINVTGSQETGTGSGVIIRSDGYILTNNHVVSVAMSSSGAVTGSISVVTTDGRTAAAKVVGADTSDDLAVVKVDGLSGLTAATFAKSSTVKVGQPVVAVGAPLGLSDTVTSGIVSNTARPVRAGDDDTAVFDAVQTDAAINPGNSGGPLVDLNGNIIGINAAIATANSGGLQIPGESSQSGSIGIGFAIPADEASRIATELITTGKATHAVIGVGVQSDSQSSSSTTSATVGATLSSVTANGPAASAGLAAGDVVTAVNSQLIDDADSLIAAIRSYAPGNVVTLTYTRAGSSHTAKVTLGSS